MRQPYRAHNTSVSTWATPLRWLLGSACFAFGLACCAAPPEAKKTTPPQSQDARCSSNPGYQWKLPKGFPTPCVPPNNPMTAAKVELGRHLFYDKRLSGNQTQSCASCHKQSLAFTDGLARSTGSTGDTTTRHSMSLVNIAYAANLTWANPLLRHLEQQIDAPLFGTEPVEMGMRGRVDELMQRLRTVPRYQSLFAKAFPTAKEQPTITQVKYAIASFQRRLISGNSPYDQAVYGKNKAALSPAARRGMRLFGSEKFECFHCHAGFNFQDAITYEGKRPKSNLFHNTGLYNIDGKGAYPPEDTGLHMITERAKDMGRFRVPTLRNIAVTAPYMHDGSIKTLDGVLDHYAAGGRTIKSGPNVGKGSDNPHKSFFMVGFEATSQERADLIAFLKSLTDQRFLTDPTLANPWK